MATAVVAITFDHTSPVSLARLDFIVIAPETSIQTGKYQKQIARDSIHSKVKRRISEYDGVLDNWYHAHFEPLLDCLQLVLLSWEEAIAWINQENTDVAASLSEFYNRCLEFN